MRKVYTIVAFIIVQRQTNGLEVYCFVFLFAKSWSHGQNACNIFFTLKLNLKRDILRRICQKSLAGRLSEAFQNIFLCLIYGSSEKVPLYTSFHDFYCTGDTKANEQLLLTFGFRNSHSLVFLQTVLIFQKILRKICTVESNFREIARHVPGRLQNWASPQRIS